MTDLVVVKQRTIRGPADHVRNAIETARRDGRLVRVSSVHRLTTGEAEVVALMREPLPQRSARLAEPPWFRRRPKLAATMVAVLLGFVGLVAWIAYQLVELIARNFAEIAFVAALIVVVLLASGHSVTKAVGCCPCHRR